MDKLPETQKFATYDPTEILAEWLPDFQTWLENKIYTELACRVNWLLSNAALPELTNYGSNALAIAGGLSIGDFYRNGDNVCIVH